MVAAAGPDADGVQPGDAVAVFLPELGGYAEQVLARYWVKVPGRVSPQDAAAPPPPGEAAARVVDEVGVAPDETVLIAGAAGSVGLIACQWLPPVALTYWPRSARRTSMLSRRLGAVPVAFGSDLVAEVKAHAPAVDAVIDAVRSRRPRRRGRAGWRPGPGGDAVGPGRAGLRLRLSGPDGPHVAQRLQAVMDLLAAGRLTLRAQTVIPLADAAGGAPGPGKPPAPGQGAALRPGLSPARPGPGPAGLPGPPGPAGPQALTQARIRSFTAVGRSTWRKWPRGHHLQP